MTWYENFLGTFCEIVIYFLFLQLFSDRYNREKRTVLLCICVIACVDTLCYSLGEGYYWLEFAIVNLLVIAVTKWVSRQVWASCIFQFVVGTLFMSLSEALLIGIWHEIEMTESISIVTRFIHLAILILFSFYIGTRRKLQDWWRLYYDRWQQILHFVMGNMFVISFIEVYLWNSKQQLYYQEIGLLFIVLLLWIVINAILLKSLLDNQKKREQLQIHTSYIEMIEGLLEELHEEKHEFRKHLQTVEGLSHQPDPKEAVYGIQVYMQDLKSAEAQKKEGKAGGYLTGNRVVNAILYMKDKEAKANHITFFYVPSNPFPYIPCQEYELIEIVGNLLNNAFDYVQGLPLTHRKVILSMEQRQDGSYIEVRNPFAEMEAVPMDKLSQKGYSTKSGDKRGYGLHRVKMLAEKYHGSLTLQRNDDDFVAIVYFHSSSGQFGSP